MKAVLLALIIFPLALFSQDKTVFSDFDGDKIKDKAYVDEDNMGIAYELSSQKFKKVFISFEDSGELWLVPSKNGFKIDINHMRAGNSYQFRYEKETGKMRLIGMSRYEFGPANNDGSGESSVNLLTNEYIAEWNYFDDFKNKLVKIPTIKQKMIFPKVYFDTMKNEFSTYTDKDVTNFLAAKKRLNKK